MYIVLVSRGRQCPGVRPYCAWQVTADFTFTGESTFLNNQNLEFNSISSIELILSFSRERVMTPTTIEHEKDVIKNAFSNLSDSILTYLWFYDLSFARGTIYNSLKFRNKQYNTIQYNIKMHSKQADTLTHELKYNIHSLNWITETQITEKTDAGAGEPSGLILHGTHVLRWMSEPSSCVFWTEQFPEIIHFTVCSIVTLSKYLIGASQTLRRRYPHTITRFLLVSRRRKRGSNKQHNQQHRDQW